VPDVLVQPHSASLGATFYDGAMFPAEYRGDMFVAFHGSWNRAHRTSPKVVRVRFVNGAPTGEYEDFMKGFVLDEQRVWARPVGVAVASDGALLVSEDGNNTIWRIARP
jgi:glucose/arabinose dehydrogenase